MKYDAIISGYISMDRIIKIGEPARAGFTSIVQNKDNARVTYGGCSANIAYLLARLGKKPLPILRLGGDDDEATRFYEQFKAAGVCMEAVTVVEDETTSNCYLILDQNHNHITIFYPGSMDGRYARPANAALFRESRFGVLTVGSYEDSAAFFDTCCRTGTRLIFGMKSDASAFPVPLLHEILLYSEIIFTNEAERAEIERLFELGTITELFTRGQARIIVTTVGKKGSIYYEKSDSGILSGHIAAVEGIPVVDTTGSGDAYMAGFLSGLLDALPVSECCKRGSVLSSFIIEKVGCITGAPTLDEFNKRFNELGGGLST